MTDERDYIVMQAKVPMRDRDGNDLAGQSLGPGGPRRSDGTLSALAYDFEPMGELSCENLDYEPSEDDDSGLAALAGLALVGLTAGVVGTIVAAAKERKAQRREREWREAESRMSHDSAVPTASPAPGWYIDGPGQERWWDGQQWTAHYRQVQTVALSQAGWYDDGSGRYRWWDGNAWTNHFYEPSSAAGPPSQSGSEPSQGSPTALPVPAQPESGTRMSREEWQARMRWMLLSHAYSEAQWALLAHATIEDADDSLLNWQAELRKLTPQRFAALVRHELDSNPALRQEAEQSWTVWVRPDEANHEPAYVPISRPPVGTHGHHQRVSATPGWYDDGSGQQRWWDGQRWH